MHCLARFARLLPVLVLAAMLSVACTPKATTYKDASAFMQARSYDKAVEKYEQALVEKPGDKRIMADLAKAKAMASDVLERQGLEEGLRRTVAWMREALAAESRNA